MVELDGSRLEGGGQILRTAMALAVITKKDCRVFNIRKNRPKPGLAHQHLLGIQTLSYFCQGRLEGDFLGSEEVRFYPGQAYRDQVFVNIPTAGSITLVLQTLIPPVLFAPSPVRITLNGGATDTFFSPTIDHFRYCFLKILEKMNARIEVNILKRSYYPTGGGKVEIKVYPTKLKPLNLTERGKFKKISIFSVASKFLRKKKVAERQARAAEEIFKKLKLPIETKIEYEETDCPGSSICIVSEFSNTFLGSDGLGKLETPAEEIGKKTAIQLLEEEKSKSCVDRFLTDQILIYLALSNGRSQIKIPQLTSHAKTNLWVIEKFLPVEFEIKDNILRCDLKEPK